MTIEIGMLRVISFDILCRNGLKLVNGAFLEGKMGFFMDLIIGSIVGEAFGSKKGGVVGAILQKDGSFKGAALGGLIGSAFEDDEFDEYDELDELDY